MAKIRVNHKLCCGSGLILLFTVAVGCSNSDVEAALAKAERQRQSNRETIVALQDRISLLEGNRSMTFVVSDLKININDQMFQPSLSASATLNAQGDHLPETLYVDMMLVVEVEQEHFKSTNRQIFPINSAGGDVMLRQPLPVHS